MSNEIQYLKFIRWENDTALFKEAKAVDLLLSFGPLQFMCQLLKMEETIIIKCPKRVQQLKIL